MGSSEHMSIINDFWPSGFLPCFLFFCPCPWEILGPRSRCREAFFFPPAPSPPNICCKRPESKLSKLVGHSTVAQEGQKFIVSIITMSAHYHRPYDLRTHPGVVFTCAASPWLVQACMLLLSHWLQAHNKSASRHDCFKTPLYSFVYLSLSGVSWN